MRPNVIDFLAVQAFSGPVQTDCGRSAPKVGVKVAIAAATGAYRLSSENVLLPRAARPSNLPEPFQGEKVLRRQPATIRADALSADQRKILDCVDSSRSVRDVLRLTSLDSGRFTSALNDLVEQQAVSLVQTPEETKTPAAEGKATTPVARGKISSVLRMGFLLAVGAAVIALSFVAGECFLVELEPVLLTVDASPYAVVEVLDADNQSVFKEETPFVVSLPPGDYSLDFTYGSRQVTRSVTLGPEAPGEVRYEFWEGADVKSLLERVLSEGVEE